MAPVDDVFRRTLLTLEADLHALGWDQPAGLYAVRGMRHDPWLQKVLLEDHDISEVLSYLPTLPRKVLGAVLVGQSLVDMPMVDGMATLREVLPVVYRFRSPRERAHFFAQQGSCAVQVRTVLALLRDGEHEVLWRQRGEEPFFVTDFTRFESGCGGVMGELHRLLGPS